jgi:hypothetical protein
MGCGRAVWFGRAMPGAVLFGCYRWVSHTACDIPTSCLNLRVRPGVSWIDRFTPVMPGHPDVPSGHHCITGFDGTVPRAVVSNYLKLGFSRCHVVVTQSERNGVLKNSKNKQMIKTLEGIKTKTIYAPTKEWSAWWMGVSLK